MNTSETLKAIELQVAYLKNNQDVIVPETLNDLEEMPEKTFSEFLNKVNSKRYSVLVYNTGDINKVFDFVAPKAQKTNERLIRYLPYVTSIAVSVLGALTANYILLCALLIPFIATFLTSFMRVGMPLVLILIASIVYFILNGDTIGTLFMVVWTISILLTRYTRYYIQSVIIKLSLNNEKIFAYLFYSRALRVIDLITNDLIYSK